MARKRITEEDLLDGSQMVLLALAAGTMGFLEKWNIPIRDWVSYIGEPLDSSPADPEWEEKDNVMGNLLVFPSINIFRQILASN